MSPQFWVVGPQTQVYTSNSGGVWQSNNAGWINQGYENHEVEHYERNGRMDEATQNWLIGGAAGNFLANIIAPDDPDAARTIGGLANLATTIGLIRNSGREREVYHRERHDYGVSQGGWVNSNNGWYAGSSQVVYQDLGMPSIPYMRW